ncbi:glycosyltransferase family 2 protein [Paenibacillus sp. F4]|nr:glycosyltransferase family 2 protein [Paenibacillus sp. F4]
MIVKNESKTLGRCLDSVANLVDEIIIVDTGSTDSTKRIASEFNAKIFDYEWTDDFAAARNFALEKSTGDWNLVLDADEYISNECGEAIHNFIMSSSAIGKIKRIDMFLNDEELNFEQIYISRLFPSTCRYTGRIHEQISSNLPRVIIDVEIKHDGYVDQTKSDRNIPILLQIIDDNPNDPYYQYQIAKEYRGLKNHEQAYIYLRRAYSLMTRNENYAPSIVVNFLYAIIASGHLMEGLHIIEKEQNFLWDYPDFHFVSALFLLELISEEPRDYMHLIPFIEKFYLRALDIGETGAEGSVIGTGSFAAHHNLGVFYETTGDITRARKHYLEAAEYNYPPSLFRLKNI